MDSNINGQILKFNLLFKKYDYIYRRAARKFEMCELELLILYVMRNFIPLKSRCTQKDLTDILLHPKQSINSALKSLVQKGYAELTLADKNTRVKYIYLTDKGISVAERTADLLIRTEKEAFLSLSEKERCELLSLFGKLTAAMEEQMDKISGGSLTRQ